MQVLPAPFAANCRNYVESGFVVAACLWRCVDAHANETTEMCSNKCAQPQCITELHTAAEARQLIVTPLAPRPMNTWPERCLS